MCLLLSCTIGHFFSGSIDVCKVFDISFSCLVMFGVVLAADAFVSASICIDQCEGKLDMPTQNPPAKSPFV